MQTNFVIEFPEEAAFEKARREREAEVTFFFLFLCFLHKLHCIACKPANLQTFNYLYTLCTRCTRARTFTSIARLFFIFSILRRRNAIALVAHAFRLTDHRHHFILFVIQEVAIAFFTWCFFFLLFFFFVGGGSFKKTLNFCWIWRR
jgi:hypothetical protein